MPLTHVEQLLFDGIADGIEISNFHVEGTKLFVTVSDSRGSQPPLSAVFECTEFHSLNVLTKNQKLYSLPWRMETIGTQYLGNHQWRFNLRCAQIEFVFESAWPSALPSVA